MLAEWSRSRSALEINPPREPRQTTGTGVSAPGRGGGQGRCSSDGLSMCWERVHRSAKRTLSSEGGEGAVLRYWWARLDSNQGPRAYQARALTT